MYSNCCDTELALSCTYPDFDVCCFCCFWNNLQMTQNVWVTFSASIRWCSACVSAFQKNVNSSSCLQEAILHKFLHHLEWGDSPFFHHEIAPVHWYDQQHSYSSFFLLLPCHRYFHFVCKHLATNPLRLFLTSWCPSSDSYYVCSPFCLIHFLTLCSHLDHGLPLWHFPFDITFRTSVVVVASHTILFCFLLSSRAFILKLSLFLYFLLFPQNFLWQFLRILSELPSIYWYFPWYLFMFLLHALMWE